MGAPSRPSRLPTSCARLVCVGQATVDTIAVIGGSLARGDQVVGSISRQLGGTAAIVAHNAAQLGVVPVSFTGHVGADAAGSDAMAELLAAGVELGALTTTPCSPEVLVIVEASGERTMVAAPQLPDWSSLALDVGPGDLVFFEGWHLFAPGAFEGLLGVAHRAGASIAIDVCSASRPADPIAHGRRLATLRPDVLIANDHEATLCRLEPPVADLELVVVHAGPGPTRAWLAGACTEYPVAPRTVLDTTGAGDAFAAGLLALLASGASLADAVAGAHEVAGQAVERVGSIRVVSHAWRGA